MNHHAITALMRSTSLIAITILFATPLLGQPVVVTNAATDATTSTAKLHGTVQSPFLPSSAEFEWGTSMAYGNTSSKMILSAATTPVPVMFDLEGLTPNTTYHFRLKASNDDGTGFGMNQSFTTAIVQEIVLVDPNGGDSLEVDSQYPIQWTASGVSNVKIQYSTNNGSDWLPIVSSTDAANGFYMWTVPNTPTDQALVRIEDVDNAGIFDVSDAVFLIVPADGSSLLLLSPDGAEEWVIGTNQQIEWTSLSVDDISIEYSTDNGTSWTTIAASTPALAGKYTWTIPNTPTIQAVVKITSLADSSVYDESDQVFSIIVGDTTKYRSFSPDGLVPKLYGKLLKPIKRGKGVPNASNLLAEIVHHGGFAPGEFQSDDAGGMRVGFSYMEEVADEKWKPIKDSAKVYSWVRLSKWNFKKEIGTGFGDIQKSLEDKTGKHSGKARGLDSLFKNGNPKKPLVGQKTSLPPKAHNNRLFGELVALKVNIVASAMEVIPVGFGELTYTEENDLVGMSVEEIAEKADSALTYWRAGGWDYVLLDSVIRKINRAFEGPVNVSDTISFASGELKFRGYKAISLVPFLSGSATASPRTIPRRGGGEISYSDPEVPSQVALHQNYPNPFNPTTSISFYLPTDALVTVKVYNVLGQEVTQLLTEEFLAEGSHEIEFDGGDLPSGVYFYHLIADSDDETTTGLGRMLSRVTAKMILMK